MYGDLVLRRGSARRSGAAIIDAGKVTMSRPRDRELGMRCRIRRRDFLNGAATSAALLAAGSAGALAGGGADPQGYPPALTGMRGSGYPDAYSVGHALRDGTFWKSAPQATTTGD
jgi:spermidine dehydrogenase